MFIQLLPRNADNSYRGLKPGLWIFGFIVVWKLAIALACTFNGYAAASVADGIPLRTFGTLGAYAVVTEYAAWGVGQIALLALCVIALVRYRSLVPLMFLVLAFEHVARRIVYLVMPMQHVAGAAGGSINLVMLVAILGGLVPTLLDAGAPRHSSPAAATGASTL